jgi:hypothetical protein
MLVPTLDHARIDGRKVNFSESAKMRVRTFEHMKNGSTLVRNPAQWNDLHSIDHG